MLNMCKEIKNKTENFSRKLETVKSETKESHLADLKKSPIEIGLI